MVPVLFLSSLVPAAEAQVWIAPRRAGQSVFRNTEQDWQTIDLLAGETIEGEEAAGVRLFFYEEERETAERAAAQIVDAYRALSERFDYVPEKRFDYVLYGTYQEFLRTNLFPLQEGVLGVTSTQSLEMAVPYFGDHTTFSHTSVHELAHEFMIQKIRSVTKDADVLRDPLGGFPLWFVEGLAEYAAVGPIEDESAMRVRDLVTNPDVYTGHGLLNFWDDWPQYVLWTYQGGHARLTFLEEMYGEGTAQRLLELSPAMVSDQGLAARIQNFQDLVKEVTRDEPETVAEKFDTWIKRRAYAEYLASNQSFAEFERLDRVLGIPLALTGSPDGTLLAYRSISPDTGRSSIVVVDPRAPNSSRRWVADGRPGVESLHPIDPRNFAISNDRIAFVAESRGRDDLIVQQLEHTAEVVEPREPLTPAAEAEPFPIPLAPPEPEPVYKVRIKAGPKARYRLADRGLLAAGSIALEPDGDRIVFVGLQEDGTRDLFLLTPGKGNRFELRQLTDDVASERDVTWGSRGLVYASDASAAAEHNIFLLDFEAGGAPMRVTSAARDQLSPTMLPDGTIVYTAFEQDRLQLFATWDGETTVRLTDLPIGANDPTPGADGSLWALVQQEGRLTPAQLHGVKMRSEIVDPPVGAVGPPFQYEQRDLSDARPYRPIDPRNWGLDGGFAAVGAGPGGVYGQAYMSFSDRLRDHALIFVAQAYGTPEFTDATLLYLNQSGRVTWGAGPFHSLRFRVDRSLNAPVLFQSGERYYGALGSLRYPFDRFVYAQLDASVGGVSYFVDRFTAQTLAIGAANATGRDLLTSWFDRNTDPRLQTEGTLRFGVDTIRMHWKTGPLAGTSALVEGTLGAQPLNGEIYGAARVDAQTYVALPLISGGNLAFKGSAATSGLGTYAIGYWLSSYDTLRAYLWGDPALLGRHYWFASSELQVPLDVIVRLALASSVEGVAAIDFGAVSDDMDELWDRRVLDAVLGTNFILGPLVLRLHFARAIDIGAPLPDAPPWVTNFSISWLGQ